MQKWIVSLLQRRGVRTIVHLVRRYLDHDISQQGAALAYYLLDPGVTVTYIVEDDNLPSRRVAEKVGFTPSTHELRVVAWKEENEG